MPDRISQPIEQAATRLTESANSGQLDSAIAEVNAILKQSGNLASDQAALVNQLEQNGTLPIVLLSFATGNDANGNGINDALDLNNDGKLESNELRTYLESVSADAPAEAVLAKALLDRFGLIEAADNERYGMAAGVQDGIAGKSALEDYAARFSTVHTNTDGSIVIHNQDGLISEVVMLSGNTRQFVHDSQGNIIQFTDAENHIYKLQDGNFLQFEADGVTPTNEAIFASSADLDRDGNLTIFNQDGTLTIFKTDGSTINIDNAGKTTKVTYADGDSLLFSYDASGRVIAMVSGQTGEPLTLSSTSSVSVDSLGVVTIIQTGETGYAQVLRTDGSSTAADLSGQIRALSFSNNTQVRFSYDQNGNMNEVSLPNGAVLTRSAPDQPWIDASGQPAATDLHLTQTGALVVSYTDGRTETYKPDGSIETESSATAVEELLSEDALIAAATDIRGALNFESALGHFGKVDSDRIINILASMSEADRRNLEAQYFERYNISLRDELQWRLFPQNYAQSIAVLDRQDGKANDLGQIEIALTQLNSDTARGQTTLVNTLMVLNSEQIQELDAQYRAAHGTSLSEALQNDGRISAATKQALAVLLNGSDANLDESGNWKPQVFDQLAAFATQSKDIRLFEAVFRHASEQSRQTFLENGGSDQIFLAFMDKIENLRLAIDLADAGEIRLLTLIRGNTHFLHIDRESIELALKHASPEDQALYLRGRQLAQTDETPADSADQEAINFYNELHTAMANASGADWELIKWEDILLRGGSLIERIADLQISHTAGIGGTYHVTDTLMSTLENMTEEDWNQLHTDASLRADLRDFLTKLLDGEEESTALRIFDQKAAASSFEHSKLTGQRTLLEVINDNSWGGLRPRYEPGIILERMLSMSEAEILQYQSGPMREQLVATIDAKLGSEPEHFLALSLLRQIDNGVTKLELTPVNQVLFDQAAKAPPHVVFQHLEQVLADPELRARVQNPQNDDDRQLRDRLYNAANNALSRAGIDQYSESALARDPRAFLERMFNPESDGNLPIDMELALCKTDEERLNVLRNLTEAERSLLLNGDPANQQAVDLRNSVLGPLNDDLKQLFMSVLSNGFTTTESGQQILAMNVEDHIRAFVLGAGPNVISQVFTDLTNDQIVVIKSEYADQYNSDLAGDVLNKVPEGDRFEYSQMLETTTTNTRQNFFDIGNEFLSHMNGLAPELMSSLGWNASKEDALRQMDQFRAELMAASSQFTELTPERAKALIDNFAEAAENFRSSKEEFSDVALDAAIIVAGTVLAFATAGQSLGALILLKSAALGAGIKVVGGRILQGDDYDSTEITGDAISGAVMMAGNLLGPATVAKILGVGKELAVRAAQFVDDFFLPDVAAMARYGLAWNRQAMYEGLEEISRIFRIANKPVDERSIAALIARTLSASPDEMLLTTAEAGPMQQLLRQAIIQKYAPILAQELNLEIFIQLSPMRHFLLRLGLNEAAAIPVGTIAAGGNRWINWNHQQSFEQNMQEIVASAGLGAAMGAGMSFAITAGATVLGYAYRTARGWYYRNNSNEPVVNVRPNGEQLQIGPGESVPIGANDRLILPEGTQIQPLESNQALAAGDMPLAPNANAADGTIPVDAPENFSPQTIVLSDTPNNPVIGRTLSPGVRSFYATDPSAFQQVVNRLRARAPETRLTLVREVFESGRLGAEIKALIQHHGPTYPLNAALAAEADLIIACHPDLIDPSLQSKAVLGTEPGLINIEPWGNMFDVYRPTDSELGGLSLDGDAQLSTTTLPTGEIEYRNADGELVKTLIPSEGDIVQFNRADGITEYHMPDLSIQFFDTSQTWLGTRVSLPGDMIRFDLPGNQQELHYPDGHCELRNLADNTVRVLNQYDDLIAEGVINSDGSLSTTPTQGLEWNRLIQTWNSLRLAEKTAALDALADAPEAVRIQIANSAINELSAEPRPRWPLVVQRTTDILQAFPPEAKADAALQILAAMEEAGFSIRNINSTPENILSILPEADRLLIWTEMARLWAGNSGELGAAGTLIESISLIPVQDRPFAFALLHDFGVGPVELLQSFMPEDRLMAWQSLVDKVAVQGWTSEMTPLFRSVDALPPQAQLEALRYAYEHFPLESWRIEEVLSPELYPQALRLALAMPNGADRSEVLRNIMWDETQLSTLSLGSRDQLEKQLVDILFENLAANPLDLDNLRSAWRQLPAQLDYITARLETHRQTLLANNPASDAEAINRAINRARAWVIDRNIPPSIAELLGPVTDSTQRPMPPWKLIAAHQAWESVRAANLLVGEQEDAFWQLFEEISAGGRNQVLLRSGDARLYIASSFAGTLNASDALALQSAVEAYSHQMLQAGASAEQANPVRLLMNLKIGAFAEALHTLHDGDLSTLSASDIRGIAESWQIEGALKLSLTFGNDWKKWLDLGLRLDPPRDYQASTNMLSLASSDELKGLAPILQRFFREDASDLLRLTLKWPTLSPEDREAIAQMNSFRNILNALAVSNYPDALDSAFAIEANKWSIPENIYRETEQRFIASRDLPSPFPDTKWISPDGNLRGFFLDRSDPRGLYLGHHTNSCQHPGGAGRTCAWYGQESPFSGFFVVTDRNGDIIAESWAWVADDGSLVFDNVEAKGLGSRDASVGAIYQQAANDLVNQFRSVSIGTANSDLDLSAWTQVGQNAIPLPADYANEYSDAANQVLLASNPAIEENTALSEVNIGTQVRYRGYTWRVSTSEDGNVVLVQDWTRSVSATDGELSDINPNHPFTVGDSYNLVDAEGNVEAGWVLTSMTSDNLTFVKQDGYAISLPSDTMVGQVGNN